MKIINVRKNVTSHHNTHAQTHTCMHACMHACMKSWVHVWASALKMILGKLLFFVTNEQVLQALCELKILVLFLAMRNVETFGYLFAPMHKL